jgi:hypothetical protein
MYAPARLAVATVAIAAAAWTGCRGSTTDASQQPIAINELRVRELALDQYRRLFADKFLLNPVDGKYYPFPALSVQELTHVEAQGDAWIVRATPPSGVSLEARVDKAGRWTELRQVTFSAE